MRYPSAWFLFLCLSALTRADVTPALPFQDHAVLQQGRAIPVWGRASAGEKITVDVLGTAVVEAGAAVAANATVKSDASGRAITWATSGAKVGLALEAAGAAGQMIEVLLIPNVA